MEPKEKAFSGYRTVTFDTYNTSEALAHANAQAIARRYEEFLIVDVDSHHYETESLQDIVQYIVDPALRQRVISSFLGRRTGVGAGQDMGGRIVRYRARAKEKVPTKPHRDIILMQRWMDAMGIDIACMFPTPMLNLSLTPDADLEVALAWAYNSWLCERILQEEPRIKSMLYLPFHYAPASLKIVEHFAEKKGVIGFMVTSTHRHAPNDNDNARMYSLLQEMDLPLAFHSASGSQPGQQLFHRFFGVHALGFCWHNMVHLTNWLINGMPERFPKLKTIWIESGLAWIPFLMQRLDNEYMMRSSEVPLLKRKPSEYISEMYFSSQPLEMVDNLDAMQVTFKMINAESQLLYASDYPHWDMDLPSTIYDLPFLSEQAKRNILGGNAQRLFNLEPTFSHQKLTRRSMATNDRS